VAKYFWAWAKVVIPQARKRANKIAYIDLFAGPGRYKDGMKSTPLLILEKAIQDADMCEMLVTIFNDANGDSSKSLEEAIKSLPGIESLRHYPQLYNFEVGTQIAQMFQQMNLVPTLFFVDPWGYKGLSLRLVQSVLKDWGCDCIFFFNYNRINMGLANELVREHMNALFGQTRADALRARLISLDPRERELEIVESLAQALRETGGRFVLPFGFRNAQGNRTSHHLIFVNKNIRGYTIMKEVMARESSKVEQGVATFEYNPADRHYPLLFELSRPLDDLAEMLLADFSGQRLRMEEIYEGHHVGKPYIKRNYKDAKMPFDSWNQKAALPPPRQLSNARDEVARSRLQTRYG